jgi:hypothetical protein
MVNQSNQSSNLCVLILLTMAVAFMLWQCFQKSNSIKGGENHGNNANVNNTNVNNANVNNANVNNANNVNNNNVSDNINVVDLEENSNTNNQENCADNRLLPKDLLPLNDDNLYADADSLEGQNFLDAGYHSGINTVGSSLRNANLQLRADPVINKVNVGPWNNSTIQADNNRKPLDGPNDC